MELLIVSLGILAALIVSAAVIDLRARRRRGRLSVDHRDVLEHRREQDQRGRHHEGGRMDGGIGGF